MVVRLHLRITFLSSAQCLSVSQVLHVHDILKYLNTKYIRSFRTQLNSAQIVPAQVDTAPLEIKYF